MTKQAQKVRFLYNPGSGDRQIVDYLEAIGALYAKHGYAMDQMEVCFEEQAASAMLEGINSDYHHLLLAGGDGTVNYLINLIKKSGLDVPVALLSTGTANDFTTLLGMPHNPMDACRAILEGEIRSVDLGSVNGAYFVNVFSCGLFTDTSQKTPTFFKNNFGKIAYYFSGLSEIPKFRKMNLSIKTDAGDFEGKALIFFVFNGRTAGNLPIAYLSKVDDGLLDVIIITADTPMETAATVVKYLHSMIHHSVKYPPEVVHIRCRNLVAHSPRNENTDIDGQAGPSFPIEIECHPGALRIIAPRQ